MPFLRRAMAAGAIEDITFIYNQPRMCDSTLHLDGIFDTLNSPWTLRVTQPLREADFSILGGVPEPTEPCVAGSTPLVPYA